MIQETIFGDTYSQIEQIGSGGGGTVYKAYHKRLQKFVVLKKIHSNFKNAEFTRKETDLLKNLRHVNLPVVFDFIETEDGTYTVMDYISGKSLLEYIKAGEVFSEAEVVKYAIALCDALIYLHEREPVIIHGDIKPGNIMLSDEGRIVLIDFNISGTMDGNGLITTGYSKGYASPEQIESFEFLRNKLVSEREVSRTVTCYNSIFDKSELNSIDLSMAVENRIDKLTDIYSLGATLFHIVSGIRIDKAIDKVRSNISEDLAFIINKCTELNPDNRYRNVSEIKEDLLLLNRKLEDYSSKTTRKKLFIPIVIVGVLALLNLAYLGFEIQAKQHQKKWNQNFSKLYLTEDLDFAARLYSKLKKKKGSVEIDIMYANKLMKAGEFEEARKILESVPLKEREKNDSYTEDMFFKLSGDLCLLIENDYKTAISHYKNIKSDEMTGQNYPNYIFALYHLYSLESKQEEVEKQLASDIDRMREKSNPYTDDFVYGYLDLMKKDYSDAYERFHSSSKSAIGSLRGDAEILKEYSYAKGKMKSSNKFSFSPIVRFFVQDLADFEERKNKKSENFDIVELTIEDRLERDRENSDSIGIRMNE